MLLSLSLLEEPPNTSPLKAACSTSVVTTNASTLSTYVTPRGSTSSINSNKSKSTTGQSSQGTGEPIRRSLRKMGINPETTGFPYYSPSKVKNSKELDTCTDEGKIGDNPVVTETDESLLDLSDQSNKSTPFGSSHDIHSNKTTQNGTAARQLNFNEKQPDKPVSQVQTRRHSSSNSNNSLDTHKDPTSPLPQDIKDTSPLDHPQSLDVSLPISPLKGIVNFVSPSLDSSEGTNSLAQADVMVDKERLLKLFQRVLNDTSTYNVDQLLRLHSHINHTVFRHRMNWDKSALIEVS